MEKRHQVFVSSTYQDLEHERQEVMHALELDCIPSGMELFPAANESQWSLIQKVIQDCDYYILIIGGRYGSIGPDGLSYTEMEYRYALSLGKPTVAFLHKEPGKIFSDRTEQTSEGKEKLKAFRELVQTKLCKFWTTPQDLGSVVSRSLIQLIRTTPAVGWVRADELPDRDATLELLRLRKKNEELEFELQRARTTAPKGTEDLVQGSEKFEIHFSFDGGYAGDFGLNATKYTSQLFVTWNKLFGVLAPLMINEASDETLRTGLNQFLADEAGPELYKAKQLAGRELRNFDAREDDFQTIKIQLRALGLITKSEKPRSVKDVETYWTLTPYGDQQMTHLRALRRHPATSETAPTNEIVDTSSPKVVAKKSEEDPRAKVADEALANLKD
jgi:hypothetical protein